MTSISSVPTTALVRRRKFARCSALCHCLLGNFILRLTHPGPTVLRARRRRHASCSKFWPLAASPPPSGDGRYLPQALRSRSLCYLRVQYSAKLHRSDSADGDGRHLDRTRLHQPVNQHLCRDDHHERDDWAKENESRNGRPHSPIPNTAHRGRTTSTPIWRAILTP